MLKPRVYVETTIPSFYHEERTAPGIVARREWTRQWWAAMKHTLNDPVIDEIREVRHRISARVDHDPTQLVTYYMEMQKQYRDRLVDPAKSAKLRDQPAV